MDSFGEVEEQLEHRRLHCISPEADNWVSVFHNNYRNALLQVNKVTTGRFMCGGNFVSFEDERDAITFKLVN